MFASTLLLTGFLPLPTTAVSGVPARIVALAFLALALSMPLPAAQEEEALSILISGREAPGFMTPTDERGAFQDGQCYSEAEVDGIEAQLGNYLAERLGLTAQFCYIDRFSDIPRALAEERGAVALAIFTFTEGRARDDNYLIDLRTAYFSTSMVFVGTREGCLDDPRKAKIVAIKGSTYASVFEEQEIEPSIYVLSGKEMFLALENGFADCFAYDDFFAKMYAKQFRGVEVVGKITEGSYAGRSYFVPVFARSEKGRESARQFEVLIGDLMITGQLEQIFLEQGLSSEDAQEQVRYLEELRVE